MRKSFFIVVAGLLAGGCASSHQSTAVATGPEHQYLTTNAAVLAFDPAGADRSIPMISRDDRGMSAFGGFEDLSSESYDIQTDDDQEYNDYPSTYERQVISDKIGVIFR